MAIEKKIKIGAKIRKNKTKIISKNFCFYCKIRVYLTDKTKNNAKSLYIQVIN